MSNNQEADMKKVCKKCKLQKEVNLFGRDKNKKDGYLNICKKCRSEQRKQTNESYLTFLKVADLKKTNPEEYEKLQAERRVRIKNWQKKNRDKMKVYQKKWLESKKENTE